ncbi:hypothetical protein, partial [Escherichia coli]|uniref:hypothetical protein n=1 Tax=Escherichia coli TaxID=562 RepID=UPI001FA9832E
FVDNEALTVTAVGASTFCSISYIFPFVHFTYIANAGRTSKILVSYDVKHAVTTQHPTCFFRVNVCLISV